MEDQGSSFKVDEASHVTRSLLDCGHLWVSASKIVSWNKNNEPRAVCILCAEGIFQALITNQSESTHTMT